MPNFRRSQRYPFRLDVMIKGTYRNTPSTTEDVSFHGIFVRSDEERAPNQLIKLIVVDPRNGEHVELLGIVARCITRAEATSQRPPGVGLSLFGNDRGTEARWVAIMRQVKLWVELGMRAPPAPKTPTPAAPGGLQVPPQTLVGVPRPPAAPPTPLPAQPVVAAPAPGRTPAQGTQRPPALMPPPPPPLIPPPPSVPPPAVSALASPPLPSGIDATRRAHERRPAKFNVTLRPEGLAALQQFEAKDVSEGGTFVLTASLVPLGSRVNLRLVHPQSGETFQIAGLVARCVDALDEAEKGIGIRFDTDALDRRAWAEFVGRLAPARREPPSDEPQPGVRVLRGPPDPPILLGPGEAPVRDAGFDDSPVSDPDLPPVILDNRERAVPVLLGPGLQSPPPRRPS